MKLIFDCRFIRHDHHDGISRFSGELFTAVSKLVPTTALISDERQLRALPEGTSYIVGNDPTNALKEIFLPGLLNKSEASHVFSPMQTMGSWGRKYKLVLTLHDLIYYTHPKAPPWLPLHVRVAWRLYHLSFWPVRVLLNRADAVVTVSKTSKALIEKRRITIRPVHVVYNAPETVDAEVKTPQPKSVSGRNQLVYMGSFMPYKNVECLIEAVKELPDFELVLLSKISKERQQQLSRQAGNAVNRIRFAGGVSDAEYATVLEGAFALVTASKEEGFGIPLVEAMQRGIPVLVSDIPIFREVASEAGRYFNPSIPTEMVSAVRELAQVGAWETASLQATKRATFFSWDDSARALLKALD